MVNRLSYWIDRFSCGVMAVTLAAMVVIVFAQVFWRYVLSASIFWSEELARYLMIWGSMFAAGVCLRRGAHMAVRFVHDLLPTPHRKATALIVYALIFFFLSVVCIFGIDLVQRMWYQRSPTLRLPMGLVYIAIPLGAALMIVHTAAIIQRIWKTGEIDETKPRTRE
jgi:TRAP-type C4-dicarboxylate transport system permease small subunit